MADPVVQQITQSQTSIPDYARPYVETLLGQAGALTDLEYNPYMQYQGDRIAQFSPMQQQSYENAALLTSAPQLQDATALAGQAGLGALNTQYTFKPADFTADTAKSMMSPYMQNVTDVQMQQAKRQADIAAQTQQAQAARSGAFGGGRDAVMRSLGNAELQRNLANIQATGLQNAYTQGMQQYNTQNQLNAQQQQFGAGLGLQGLQTALQGAQQLGNLGQTQYAQNVGNINLQNTLGLQQQQQAQNVMNTQYQDFLNAQNYPYKQLGFMSDLLRGLPLTQQSSTVYGQAPSTTSQLVGLGTAALGASKLAGLKEGGLAKLALMKIAEGAA
jgi:hypothetical protein